MLAAILTAALSLAPPCYCGGNPDSKLCACGDACRCLAETKLEVVDPTGLKWERFPGVDLPDWLLLTRDGKQVGSYQISSRTYRPVAGGRVGDGRGETPIPLPKDLPKATYQAPVYYRPAYTPSFGACKT